MSLVRQKGKASAETRRKRRLRFYRTRARELRMIAKALASTKHPILAHIIPMRRCNLDCGYCNEYDDVSNPVPLDEMKRRLEILARMGTTIITISGGEPLMQHRFVLKVFAAVKEMGVHTALDSNGYFGDRLTDADLGSIDLVLLDLKAMTPDLHRRYTGMDNQPVHDFARRLAAARKPIWVRFVLVPGWTDDMAEVGRIAEFAASLGNVERVDVLPFHQMGRFKWEKLGMEYKLKDTQPPSRAVTDEAIARFRAAGLKAF